MDTDDAAYEQWKENRKRLEESERNVERLHDSMFSWAKDYSLEGDIPTVGRENDIIWINLRFGRKDQRIKRKRMDKGKACLLIPNYFIHTY